MGVKEGLLALIYFLKSWSFFMRNSIFNKSISRTRGNSRFLNIHDCYTSSTCARQMNVKLIWSSTSTAVKWSSGNKTYILHDFNCTCNMTSWNIIFTPRWHESPGALCHPVPNVWGFFVVFLLLLLFFCCFFFVRIKIPVITINYIWNILHNWTCNLY